MCPLVCVWVLLCVAGVRVCVFITQLSAVSRRGGGVSGGENPLCKVGHGVRSLVSG